MTPSWRWHDHGNDSPSDMVWVDGLDLPFANLLDVNFFEDYERDGSHIVPLTRQTEDSHQRWGRNLRPSWERFNNPLISPLVNYRWKDSRDTLHALRGEVGSPFDGIIMQYVNPLTGGPTLPTIASSLQLLRKGEHTKAHRHTSSTIYHAAEGGGRTIINGQSIDWVEGDTFVLPSWAWHEHESISGEAVLFSYSDRPVIDCFGWYREESNPLGWQS
jgi:gentisate 1,2-dioxygenase